MNEDEQQDPSLNVLGEALQVCSTQPLTGFYRDGSCNTGPQDVGLHGVCVVADEAFLSFSSYTGNDLSTPAPEYGFPGHDRLLKNSPGAALARKMLRCKARDEGRIRHTKPRSATPQMGIFRANPSRRGFPGGLLCRAACEGGYHSLRVASRIPSRKAAPRPRGVLQQPVCPATAGACAPAAGSRRWMRAMRPRWCWAPRTRLR